MNRRRFFVAVSTLASVTLAGCTSGNSDSGGDTTQSPTSTATGTSTPTSTKDELFNVSAVELLPTPEDFEKAGWTASGVKTEPKNPTDADYASRTYLNDPDSLIFDVWVYETVEAANAGYSKRVEERTSNRSTEAVDVGEEGVAYSFGWAIVEFRDANVTARIGHVDSGDGEIRIVKERAKWWRQLWRD